MKDIRCAQGASYLQGSDGERAQDPRPEAATGGHDKLGLPSHHAKTLLNLISVH